MRNGDTGGDILEASSRVKYGVHDLYEVVKTHVRKGFESLDLRKR